MRPHLPEEELHAYLDGELSRAQRAEIAEHLLACLICRALEAEVRALQSRSRDLLALAAPRSIRGLELPAAAPRRRRLGPAAAVAAGLILAVTTMTMNRGAVDATGGPVLASAFVAPAILARVVAPVEREAALLPAVGSAAARRSATSRTLTLASRATMAPRVMTVSQVSDGGGARLRMVDPMVEVDPGNGGASWQTTSMQQARETAGTIAHLDGIPVNAVRLQPSRQGGRPTAMVRQVLPDGRAVWVVEGSTDEIGPVTEMLEASGLTLAAARRARPDYVGTDASPIRTVRMVTVAGYLPIDSLEALAGSRLRVE